MSHLLLSLPIGGNKFFQILRRSFKERDFLILRLCKTMENKEKTYSFLTIPLDVLDDLEKAINTLRTLLRVEIKKEVTCKYDPRQWVCPSCKTNLAEIRKDYYECKCGETKISLLTIREALDFLYHRIRGEKFYEDLSGG